MRLTEASLNVLDPEHVSAAWTLRAPDGPLDGARSTSSSRTGSRHRSPTRRSTPSSRPGSSIACPTDLPEFLATLRRLLRPGGRWLNQGPLLYPPETPFPRRYSRDEVVALATAAGFEVGPVDAASRPYLLSPLTGAGKIERVLTFSAVRAD